MNWPGLVQAENAAELDGHREARERLAMTLAKVRESVQELPVGERAELLDWLWESLQPQAVIDAQTQWAIESEGRIDAVELGAMETVDGKTAIARLKQSLGS
jgi:hypothetical protein